MMKWCLVFVLLVSISSSGCALGLVDMALGDKKAAHADDQSVETGGNQGNFK